MLRILHIVLVKNHYVIHKLGMNSMHGILSMSDRHFAPHLGQFSSIQGKQSFSPKALELLKRWFG